jgi:hypothetical protein
MFEPMRSTYRDPPTLSTPETVYPQQKSDQGAVAPHVVHRLTRQRYLRTIILSANRLDLNHSCGHFGTVAETTRGQLDAAIAAIKLAGSGLVRHNAS